MGRTAVHLTHRAWPLPQPQLNAVRQWSRRESILLRYCAPSGAWGRGEAAPLPTYSDDDLRHADAALRALAAGRPAPSRPSPSAALAALARCPYLATLHSASARFAWEGALLEAWAREHGLALWQLLRAAAGPPQARVRCDVAYAAGPGRETDGVHRGASAFAARSASPSPSVARLSPGATAALQPSAWQAMWDAGWRTFKCKIGPAAGLVKQITALRRMRAHFGAALTLRLDANQSLTPAALSRHADALAALGPAWVEEPVAWPHYASLPRLPFAVALDESLHRDLPVGLAEPRLGLARARLRRAAEAEWAQVAVLKPSCVGGVLHTLALATEARRVAMPWLLSHSFEGEVGYALLLSLAWAWGAPVAQGLGPHAALRRQRALQVRSWQPDALAPALHVGLPLMPLVLS